MCERWLNFERLLIAPTLDAEACASEKPGGDDEQGPTPKAKRANTKLGEGVSPATIWGRRSRARRKAMAESSGA